MDAAEETPQLVCHEKRPRVDGEALGHSPTQAVAVAKVRDDDDLLREIIVRVGFPTTLIRAALVCKRWLEHASDPKFLSRFHKLHPPRLLGYYITEELISSDDLDTTHFVPMLPQPPELSDAILNLESYNFRSHKITHCQDRDATIFVWRCDGERWTHEVHRPLCYERRTQILPPLPDKQDRSMAMFSRLFSKEEGSMMSYMYVSGESMEETKEFTVRIYKLQDGEWRMDTLATCPRLYPIGVHFGHNKIYLPSTSGEIIILDLMALSYSTIQLPQGVKEYQCLKSLLSRADDAFSVYLSHVKGFQLRIWVHNGDNWLLVDTICLREIFSTLGMSGHTLENEGIANVLIRQVGDNAQFVILQMGDCIFYLDVKSKSLCKVYENKMNDRDILCAHSFMMIWPPTFPALKDDPARKLLDGQ